MNYSAIPVFVLFIISIVGSIFYTNVRGIYCKKIKNNNAKLFLFSAIMFLVTLLMVGVFGLFKYKFSSFTIWIGLAFGFFIILSVVLQMFSFKLGQYSYSVLLYNLAAVLSGLFGFLFWHESLNALQIIGFVLMLAFLVLSCDFKKGEKKQNILWYIISIFGMISTALIGVIQKVHQTSEHADESLGFLTVSFILASFLSLILYFIFKKFDKSSKDEVKDCNKKGLFIKILLIVLSGVGYAICHSFNLYLVGAVDTMLFFPLANGIPLLFSIIIGFVFLKEKLTKLQIIGFVVGLIAIILLCIPI